MVSAEIPWAPWTVVALPSPVESPHIVGGESDGQVAAGVSHRQATAAVDVGDQPAVAVLDPVGGRESKSAVVRAGDDHISCIRLIPVGQGHLGYCSAVIEPMLPGTAVELRDQLPGRGDHDRVEPGRSIRNPSVECILGRGRHVAEMNPAMIKIKVECLRFAYAEGEGGLCFGAVGEAMQLGQVEGAVALLDVAQDAAGADRGELLIITNQPDTRAAIDGKLDCGVEGQGVGHAGLVDDDQRRRADRGRPVRESAVS